MLKKKIVPDPLDKENQTTAERKLGFLERLIPGYRFIQRGQYKSGILTLTVAFSFVLLAAFRIQLIVGSLKSFFLSAFLAILSWSEFIDIFSADILEFWIGAFYLIFILTIIYRSSHKALLKPQLPKSSEQSFSQWQLAWKEFLKKKVALSALFIAFLLYTIAFLAPFLAPYAPNSQKDFIVTAYQPPLSKFDVLVFQEEKKSFIPLRQDRSLTATVANELIRQNEWLRLRGNTAEFEFVNAYQIEGTSVVYKQGSRVKSEPLTSFRDHDKLAKTASNENLPFVEQRTFLLGTDQYGRDIFSRVIYGSRISLSIGFLVVLIAVTLGTILGVVSGYFGGFTDGLIMRFVDILIAFPGLFLILIIISAFGNSIFLIVLTLSFTGWMGVSRLVRGQILSLKEQEFILAAKALGLSNARIIFRHLVPNSLTPVIVAATLRIGSIILTEAGLSFLGLGVQPPTASWGNIINEGRDNLLNHWWISTFPGLSIVLTVVCFNLIGDGIRDAIDPRMRD
ncbi:binding-protein-dependent transport systems inner membrane component [Chloroherpeton thalassium ATCC 35110]|uniref:Binding-protein-dependent transport systems inner membrane component n=1 Tax=Chloroherpeton thalassium (strain ATCC 35110 / GB-78) TaxID=517418 RepID=B3QWH8_CHLT3|nr:ABC transporter permease [Chloroherpeton thalassium]ACF14738.1 binding-protein-dependent transport systems inner membrane component [Chloroherpeton thalassium ATCC 35110]